MFTVYFRHRHYTFIIEKIPAVGKTSYGRDFVFEQKSSENLGISI